MLYTYDDLGRVTSITYDDGKRVTYTYDPAGNRTQHTIDTVGNQNPSAVNDQTGLDVNFGSSVAVFPLPNDSDPDLDVLVVQSVGTPAYGTATIGGGGTTVTYNYSGAAQLPVLDTFSYTISDGRGGFATATIFHQGYLPSQRMNSATNSTAET